MIQVTIVKVSKPFKTTTKYGEKDKVIYTVEDAKGNVFETSKFVNSEDPKVVKGDICMMDIEKSGKWFNCRQILKVEDTLSESPLQENLPGDPPPAPHVELEEKQDEDVKYSKGKAKEINKSVALKLAVKVFIANLNLRKYDGRDESPLDLMNNEVQLLYKCLLGYFE